MITAFRDAINHLVLNKLLVIRYHMRRRPYVIRLITLIEMLFVKIGLIYYGHKKA